MPKVSDPPLTGLAVEIPFRPGPLVCEAPASPLRAPAMAAPAPSASPPAKSDRRSKECVMAKPPESRSPLPTALSRRRLQLRDRLRVAGDWGVAGGVWQPVPPIHDLER